jgi:hypothetical protein
MGRSLQEESTDEEIPASDSEVVEDPATPAGTTATGTEDDEEVLVDTGIKYEALYPAPYLTLQQV